MFYNIALMIGIIVIAFPFAWVLYGLFLFLSFKARKQENPTIMDWVLFFSVDMVRSAIMIVRDVISWITFVIMLSMMVIVWVLRAIILICGNQMVIGLTRASQMHLVANSAVQNERAQYARQTEKTNKKISAMKKIIAQQEMAIKSLVAFIEAVKAQTITPREAATLAAAREKKINEKVKSFRSGNIEEVINETMIVFPDERPENGFRWDA